jgi:hypothetical protein
LCAVLAFAPSIAAGQDPGGVAPNPAVVDRATSAWNSGNYDQTLELLEPYANAEFDDPFELQRVLLMLADAAVNSRKLPDSQGKKRATEYLERVMQDPSWEMPPAVYSPALYALYLDLATKRSRESGQVCAAKLRGCQADLTQTQADLQDTKAKLTQTERRLAEKKYLVVPRTARSRALAFIPFGVGHFYNGGPRNTALGATFLSLELASGIAGLGLLINRVAGQGCRRTRAFQEGSLVCANMNEIQTRRKAEEAMAWVFLGSAVLDVVLAQILFEEFSYGAGEWKTEQETGKESPATQPPKRKRRAPRTRIRFSPTAGSDGVGFSLRGRF